MPDLRGLFLRGHGSQTHSQNNGTEIGITTTIHSSGVLGGIQGDAARNLYGHISRADHISAISNGTDPGNATGAFYVYETLHHTSAGRGD